MKKKYLLFVYSLVILLTSTLASNAQITITPSATAAVLANKLVGAGVTMLNPTLTCATVAEGTFMGTSTLSFDSGIILCSGKAVQAGGAASGFSSTANGTPGDPQLTALAGQPTYDACVLQFDFRPLGDTVKFDYVFGSEEYNGFTCSNFNDVFGFFISGPGIAGTPNIALVPGTTIPVCINSVNCGGGLGGPISTCNALGAGSPFCAYYVNNLAGTTIRYDGITTTLTAIHQVTPCDTYHLKIGIADATDDIYDSGVFLRAGSLTSNVITVSAMGLNPADTGFGSQYCIRGCKPGEFIFHNEGNTNDSVIIHYLIGGTGINGTDYATIPDSAIIHAHDSTDTVFIYGLTTASGTKTVKLYILSPYSCSGSSIVDSVELTIYDSLMVNIITPDTTVCLGQSVLINTTGSSGLHYSWTPSSTLNNSTLQSPTATPPPGTTTYVVTGTIPGTGCPPATDQIHITAVPPPPPPMVTDPNPYCQGDTPIPFTVTASYPVYWYSNASGAGQTPVPPAINTSAPGTYTFYFNQENGTCPGPIDSITIVVNPTPATNFTFDIARGCTEDLVAFTNTTTGALTYSWDFGDGSPAVTGISPTYTYPRTNGTGGLYTVTLTAHGSSPACVGTATQLVDTRHGVTPAFIPVPDTVCAGDPVLVEPDTTSAFVNGSSAFVYLPANTLNTLPVDSLAYVWDFGDGTPASTLDTPSHAYTTPGVYTVKIVVTDTIGCKDSISHPVYVLGVNINMFDDTTLCLKGDMYLQNTITLTPQVSDNYTYSWTEDTVNLSDLNIQHPYLTGYGTFTDVLTATVQPWGCYRTHTIIVHSVLGAMLTNVTPDAVIAYGTSLQLNSDNEVYYHWIPNDGSIDNPNINNPHVTPLQTTVYTIYGMDQYGCVDSAFVTVTVDSTVNEGIPSAFTPNGDGLNDVFRPVGIKYQHLVEFRVFNRWGQQVFYTNEVGKGWDGTYNGVPQDLGVYNYTVIVAHPDGTNVKYKGDVTLIR